jgi:hypothetical protein
MNLSCSANTPILAQSRWPEGSRFLDLSLNGKEERTFIFSRLETVLGEVFNGFCEI